MALDSKLILDLTRHSERVALLMEQMLKATEKNTETLVKLSESLDLIHLELVAQSESMDDEGSSDDEGEESDEEEVEAEADEHDSDPGESEDEEELVLPKWVPADVRAELSKKKNDPAFWLGLVGKVAKGASANGSANGHATKKEP